VSIYSTGLRNAYDIVKTESGKFYTFDNGPNSGWGGAPAADCDNDRDDGGSTFPDGLLLLSKGSYHGHPNPTRGDKGNKFNASQPQSPIDGPANAEECDYKQPGQGNGALTTIASSSNGLDEYTASNFGTAMQGDLLVASFNKNITRIQLNGAGTAVTSKSTLFDFDSADDGTPLDLTTQGDDEVFPGTIWVADFGKNKITVFEPDDF